MSSKKRNNGSVAKIQGHYYNNNDDSCFQEIKEMAPISIKACKGNQLLITLTVLDTWCEKAGDGAWFAIKVNNKILWQWMDNVFPLLYRQWLMSLRWKKILRSELCGVIVRELPAELAA